MKYRNGIAIAVLSFCGLSTLSTASALDLRKVTKDLFYECRNEMSAGLYKDPKSGKIEATVFQTDPSERWEMRLVRLKSQEDLKKVPHACGSEREKRGSYFPKIFYDDFPEFCKITTYVSEGRTLVTAEHCELTSSSSNERHNGIACGLGNTTFFDSDRLFGIDGENSIPSFGYLSAKFVRYASVSKFVCQRLDR
jgi:hypothetical protein